MNTIDCGTVREAIPEWVHGRIAPDVGRDVELHVAACEACASEAALVRLLHGSRARPQADLEARVRRGVTFDRQALHRPWWALTAAAVAALALGIGLGSGESAGIVAPAFAMEVEEAWPRVLEDELGMGTPVLDDLSDDALEALLADLSQVDGGF